MDKAQLDLHGQPRNRYFNMHMREARAIEQLLGFVRGVLSDGVVTDDEARSLREWIGKNPDLAAGFPGRQIADRLFDVFADGKIDGDERQELLWMLEDTIGERAGEQDERRAGASRLPFTQPPPVLTFPGKRYVITGLFAYGVRKNVEAAICGRGAECQPGVTRQTDVVVVGVDSSRDWVHGSYGTKIEKAIELRERGYPIVIVGQEHWINHL